jgi:hypothetical protein
LKQTLFVTHQLLISALLNCPMSSIKPIIQRAVDSASNDPALQMQVR